jgi:aryl-alcohol dehydrogenase-like predicted oxidoreductase
VACVLCGARDAQQARENAAAGAIRLSPEELETIGNAVHA